MIKDIQAKLLALNVNEYTDTKNGLTYLSWSHAWEELLKIYPEATYNIKKDERMIPYFGDEEVGYMVYTDITIDGITREMWLFVMNGANKAMRKQSYTYTARRGEKTCEAMSMFDVNKTIMRCLVKNLAMFGLGIYVYKGEDLPQVEQDEIQAKQQAEELEKERQLAIERCNKGITELNKAENWVVERFNKELDVMTLEEVKEVLMELKVEYTNRKDK
jgi:hypothetical protein